MEIVNLFHSVTLDYLMVVMPQSNAQAISLTFVLMESALVTKTSVKFNLLVQKIDHSDVTTKLVLQTNPNAIQYLSAQSANPSYVHQEFVPNILTNVKV